MYAIVNVIYGYPMTRDKLEEAVSEGMFEDEPDGFLSYYTGSGDVTPAAFVVDIGGFDEACDYVDPSDINLIPTEEQKAEVERLLSALDPERQALIRESCDPFVFFLWSTS